MEKETRAQLYKKSGRYYVRISYYEEGKRKNKNFPTGIQAIDTETTKGKQCEKAAMKKMAEIHNNFQIPTKETDRRDQMFVDTISDWLEQRRGSKAASTMAGYQYAANDVMLYFGEIHPVKTTDLTSNMVERYQNWERARRKPEYTGEHKKNAKYRDGSGIENTVKHRTTLIRSVLQFAKREGIVDRNVASLRDSHIDLPSPQHHEFAVLSIHEAQYFIKMLNGEKLWFQVAVLLGLLFGLRRSEIIGLRMQDIDWVQGTITVRYTVTQQTLDRKNILVSKPFTKNKRVRSFEMTKPIAVALKALLVEHQNNKKLFGKNYDNTWNDYLIRYPDGKLVSPNALTNEFARFIQRKDIKRIRFHDLRHSCASILYANGTDLLTIQQILGHLQLSTTTMYTHIINQQQSKALGNMSSQLWEESIEQGVKESDW